MAKPSRSKQPEFDPRELEDLILTPAVGTGVGSHLLRRANAQPEHQGSSQPKPIFTEVGGLDVDTFKVSTGVESQNAEVDNCLDLSNLIAIPEDTSTVVMSGIESHVESYTPSTISLWLTESGEVVPESRVRRIRLAQDVLNSAEESVYDTLWNAKGSVREPSDTYRFTQAGYDYLMKRTRLSKKTIQRIVDRLIDKDFIAIERPADIYRRTSTTYRVFSYRSVLDRHAARGRFHAVKIGPGFLFARKLESNMTTVVSSNATTGVNMSTPTAVVSNVTTVAPQTTKEVRQISDRTSSSSEAIRLKKLLESALGIIDDDATRKLIHECRSRAGDCTMEEIAFFVSQKLRLVRSIQNPIGFMLTAVPRHFEANGHLTVRELLKQQAEQQAQQWRETYTFWSSVANDPATSPEERSQAQVILADLYHSPERPTNGVES